MIVRSVIFALLAAAGCASGSDPAAAPARSAPSPVAAVDNQSPASQRAIKIRQLYYELSDVRQRIAAAEVSLTTPMMTSHSRFRLEQDLRILREEERELREELMALRAESGGDAPR